MKHIFLPSVGNVSPSAVYYLLLTSLMCYS